MDLIVPTSHGFVYETTPVDEYLKLAMGYTCEDLKNDKPKSKPQAYVLVWPAHLLHGVPQRWQRGPVQHAGLSAERWPQRRGTAASAPAS